MRGKRSSILLYFDNYHRVAGLPDEQLGLLFRALMECGERESGGQDGITGFESRYPAMSEKTQMAFLFMADTIRRDAAPKSAPTIKMQPGAGRRGAGRSQPPRQRRPNQGRRRRLSPPQPPSGGSWRRSSGRAGAKPQKGQSPAARGIRCELSADHGSPRRAFCRVHSDSIPFTPTPAGAFRSAPEMAGSSARL